MSKTSDSKRIPVSEIKGCRDCGARVPKRHWYCEDCKGRRYREAQQRYRDLHPDKLREKSRARWQKIKADPDTLAKKHLRHREYYAANRDAWTERSLRVRHEMTAADLRTLWESQRQLCYLCELDLLLEEAVIDHDHRCCGPKKSCPKCRRGLAHNGCNQLIGIARDDAALLRLIAANLEAVHVRAS